MDFRAKLFSHLPEPSRTLHVSVLKSLSSQVLEQNSQTALDYFEGEGIFKASVPELERQVTVMYLGAC